MLRKQIVHAGDPGPQSTYHLIFKAEVDALLAFAHFANELDKGREGGHRTYKHGEYQHLLRNQQGRGIACRRIEHKGEHTAKNSRAATANQGT